jgi:hypothetical protein
MMNIRVILLIMLVLVFAVGLGTLSLITGSTINLQKAQAEGKATIVQDTPAGTVPHTITIYNNNSNSILAQKGTVLTSPNSQDLVIAEDKTIPARGNQTIKAYCTQPDQKATPGSQLQANQTASPEIINIIENSNPSDVTNATNSQLKIWAIVTGGDVNIYSGEAAALVQTQGTTYIKLKQDLDSAKTQVLSTFNLTEQSLKSLNTTNSTSEVKNLFEDIKNWISSTLGMKQ